MSDDTIEKVVNWIVATCDKQRVKYYRAHILGGEPFSQPTKLLFLIDNLKRRLTFVKAPQEGQFVVFTNGDFLNSYILAELKIRKAKILLNPTYDSLEIVQEKMNNIWEVCGGVSLAVVLDEVNMERIGKLTDLAISFNSHIRINRLYNGGIISGYIDRYEKNMLEVFDKLLTAERPMWPNFIMESTTPTWNGKKNPNFCGKCFVAIDPTGKIRSCNGDINTIIGDTSTLFSKFSFSHRWSAKHFIECQECEFVLYCQGGCPYTRKLTYGTYDHKTPFCSAFKQLFPKLMELKDKWVKTHRTCISSVKEEENETSNYRCFI